jgi:hypothetical protein
MLGNRRGGARPQESFGDFEATALFCGRCRAAQPVRERLLLILPEGELHEYVCATCGGSVGTRKVTAPAPILAP